MKKFGIVVLVICSWLTYTSGMSFMAPFPDQIFQNPVEGTILLSGTFGELRANHFHAGVDIKGQIGKPLFAAGEGYVARVKVEEGGYGKALYINHPNGFTTVYAHMNNFTPEIEEWVKKEQYRRKSYTVDLQPKPGQFTFERGASIGQMGTTGYSFGPHLHFEVRRSDSQRPVNPLFFGVKFQDRIPPALRQLKVYELDERRNTIRELKVNTYKSSKGYRIVDDTLVVNSGFLGFGLMAYDQMNGAPNRNGIYQLSLFDDQQLHYRMEMQSFSFAETRYLNAHLDYFEKTKNRSNYYRAYILPGNRASIYVEVGGDGTIQLQEGQVRKIDLVATDFHENASVLTFWVKKETAQVALKSPEEVKVPMSKMHCESEPGFEACFSKGSFYADLDITLSSTRQDSLSPFAPVYELGDPLVPVHRYFSIRLRPDALPASKKKKAFIGFWDHRGNLINIGGEWEGETLVSRQRSFGQFTVMTDEEPPSITPINFDTDIRKKRTLRFRLNDNVQTSGRARGLRYRGYVDGQWILFRYDAKNRLLWHEISDGRIGPGKHQLRLEVWDDRKNRTVWEKEVVR